MTCVVCGAESPTTLCRRCNANDEPNKNKRKRFYHQQRDIDVDAEQIELGAYEPGNLDSEY